MLSGPPIQRLALALGWPLVLAGPGRQRGHLGEAVSLRTGRLPSLSIPELGNELLRCRSDLAPARGEHLPGFLRDPDNLPGFAVRTRLDTNPDPAQLGLQLAIRDRAGG